MSNTSPITPILQLLWEARWLVALVLLMAVAKVVLPFYRPRLKGWWGERRLKAALDRMGLEHLHDVYLPSRDGATQVDHVVRLPGALLVIETKNYSGLVVGGANAARWTQVHAGGRVRNQFQNPLRQNHGHVLAVREATGGRVSVAGLVVFVGTASFGREGTPDGVTTLRGLRKAVDGIKAANPRTAGVDEAWAALGRAVAGQDRRAMMRLQARTRENASTRDAPPKGGRSRRRG